MIAGRISAGSGTSAVTGYTGDKLTLSRRCFWGGWLILEAEKAASRVLAG